MQENPVLLQVRVDPALKRWLQHQAIDHQRSLAEEVNHLLRQVKEEAGSKGEVAQ